MTHRIGALVLAAGFSRRFGGNKLAAPMADGRKLIEHTLGNIAAAIAEIVIVTRDETAERFSPGAIPLLVFDGAEQGMGASLAFGVSQLPTDWDGCLVCLADMPHIGPETYRQLASRLGPKSIVIPRHNGRRGHPVGFGRDFFPELARLDNDRGGQAIIARHQGRVEPIEIDDPAILIDIDTPKELDPKNLDPRP